MKLKFIDIVAALALNLIQCAYSENILSCNMSLLHTCPGKNQMCEAFKCTCTSGYVFVGDECEAQSDNSSKPHSATTAVVVIFTLALLTCGLVLIVRKYNLIEYLRQKINLRRNNDVLYEDVMIGNDDPPLSP